MMFVLFVSFFKFIADSFLIIKNNTDHSFSGFVFIFTIQLWLHLGFYLSTSLNFVYFFFAEVPLSEINGMEANPIMKVNPEITKFRTYYIS